MVAEHTKAAYTILEAVDHPLFTLHLRSDGIVQLNTIDTAWFTLKEAKEFVEALEKITKGKPHFVLKVPGRHASVDSDARSYMATYEALRFSIAEAVVVRNLAQRLIGNFYLKFDKPVKPIRLFNTTEDAEKWLNELRNKITG